jgi:hypothetical protein
LFDKVSAQAVQHDTPESIYAEMLRRAAQAGDPRLVVTFPVEMPLATSAEELTQWLSASGFTRVHGERTSGDSRVLDVVADRFRIAGADKARVLEAIARHSPLVEVGCGLGYWASLLRWKGAEVVAVDSYEENRQLFAALCIGEHRNLLIEMKTGSRAGRSDDRDVPPCG